MRTIFLSIFVIFPLLLSAQLLKGKAVKITDGDTFTLLVDGHEQVRIRIDGIDAPEKGQASDFFILQQIPGNLIYPLIIQV